MKKLDRRIFLRTSVAGAAGLAVFNGMNTSAAETEFPAGAIIPDIIKRPLGNTGIQIPVVSLGCGKVDSPSVIKAAMKLGFNHFDTAYTYQSGNSEKMLGETLKAFPRDSFIISTKSKQTASLDEFLTRFHESLTRLQMDYVDILYAHSRASKEEVMDEVALEGIKQLMTSGKVRFPGVSTHKNEPDVIQAVIDSKFYRVVLTTYNFKQDHQAQITEKIKLAAENGIGVIAMKIMAGGFLDKEKTKPVNFKAALRWALKDESVTTAIPSIINLEQLQDNAEVLTNTELTEQEKTDLAHAATETGLFCNACQTCLPQCRKNLPIPELMRAYMYAFGYSYASKAKELVTSLGLPANPCEGCNDCTVNCIKNFAVREKIAEISRISEIPTAFLS